MVDCCRIAFYLLASGMIFMGLILTAVGFTGPSTLKEKEHLEELKKYDTQMQAAFYGIGMAGLGMVGLAIFGILSVKWHARTLIGIFCIILIVIAVLLLILSGLAFAAVYLRTKAFKDLWRPIMEKWSITAISFDVAKLTAMQIDLQCCGLSGEDVYKDHKILPFSCCAPKLFPGRNPGLDLVEGLNPLNFDPAKFQKGIEELQEAVKRMENEKQFLACTREKVKELKRKGCDRAHSESFILLGEFISYVSLLSALYLIGVVVIACCIKKND